MEVLSKEKRKEKKIIPGSSKNPSMIKSIPKEPIVSSMKPDQEKMLLEELLGNFSDQTGACFG